MRYPAVFLFQLSVWSFLSSFVVKAKLFADCTFEEVKSSQSVHNTSVVPIKLNGQLPYSKNVFHSCLVKADNRNSLLFLRAKRNKESKGSLHVSVYGADESSLGHFDILKSSFDQSGFPVCPYPSSNEINENYLTFSGTPGLNFALEIAQVEDIKLGETRPFTLSSHEPVRVFKFVPTEDISDTQLDVTVTSESADVPAYLKVSRVCQDVEKDNIDEVNYKGESLRLSFAKKGRITLSRVSVPPLTSSTSSWFIGIAIKNATGKTWSNATKTVNLTLTRSFDYSYSRPLWILGLGISFTLGVLVSLWAWFSFRECICRSQCTASAATEPINNTVQLSWGEFFLAMWHVISRYSFGRGPKTYSYITFIVGSVLMVGAFQFVFANWYVMYHEGDRDNCYYNDFCYRVRYIDIPYNLMLSNLAYVVHGLILVVNVCCLESELLARCRKLANRERSALEYQAIREQNQNLENDDRLEEKQASELCPESRKKKFTFTIGYAFGWALTFEGLFSALYHLCPSKLTFQFDTAFMFVIASLIVALLYNGIDMQERSTNVTGENQVAAANLFLCFLVPLFIFNYLGTMHHSEAGLITPIDIPFLVFLALWVVCMAWWAGYRLFPESCSCNKEGSRNEPGRAESQGDVAVVAVVFYCLGLVALIVFVVLLATNVMDFPETFLFTCITETAVVSLGKLCARGVAFWKSNKSRDNSKTKRKVLHFIRLLSRFFYVSGTLGIWVAALVFFAGKETTNKVKSPEQSRDLNQECYWLGFFDSHDIWHILSSFALLMSALLAIHVSYDPKEGRIRKTLTIGGMGSSLQSLVLYQMRSNLEVSVQD